MTQIMLEVDGKLLPVRPGVSVAAALWNAGVTGFRRSVHGEPRAPLCGMGSCHECRVTIDGRLHQRACLFEVRPGMRIETGG